MRPMPLSELDSVPINQSEPIRFRYVVGQVNSSSTKVGVSFVRRRTPHSVYLSATNPAFAGLTVLSLRLF